MQLVSFLEPEIQDISDLPGIDAEDSSEEQQVGDGDKQCDLGVQGGLARIMHPSQDCVTMAGQPHQDVRPVPAPHSGPFNCRMPYFGRFADLPLH